MNALESGRVGTRGSTVIRATVCSSSMHTLRVTPMAITELVYRHRESYGIAVSASSDIPCPALADCVPIFPQLDTCCLQCALGDRHLGRVLYPWSMYRFIHESRA